MSEMNPIVAALAEKVAEHVTYDKEGKGQAAEHTFVTTLPEHLSVEGVKEVFEHLDNYAAAGALVAGQKSIGVMKEHHAIEKTHLQLPTIGKDHFEFTVSRQSTVSAGVGKDAGTKEVYGQMTRKFVTHSIDKNAGNMKAVVNMLSNEARDAFEKVKA